MNQKDISSIVIILIIVGVLVVGGGIYWWQKDNINKLIFGQQLKDWQTYRNEKYGFEMKYPSTWKQCATGDTPGEKFILTGAEQKCSPGPYDKLTDVIGISAEYAIFKKYPNIASLKKGLENAKASVDEMFIVDGVGLFEIGELKEVAFNGMQGLRVEQISPTGYDGSIGVYIFHNQNLLRVTYAFNSTSNEMKNEGDQILSTFKFIQPSVTVLSPNGGEVWEIGKTYEIKYQIKNRPTINIENWKVAIFLEPLEERPIESHYLKDDKGFINWTIPNWTIPSDFYSAEGFKIGVSLSDITTGGMYESVVIYRDFSDAPFSIKKVK